ncbi:membrane protein required for colicin V production [Rhodovulum imhoffii]|uniref:Membrane protein required for colicin V production n=1 Tax=Rhodovulum imhoffii TaxID=365340 RepID=A0A2T5BTD4_9RHOB|nr:CvpA family protein [Rhodovulum imhoffii]MBK5934358.1 colicin V production CvpA [Rhodovulum imhoffii]PTN02691.1 membrane protein required for colicin V production [Rhodovulum imhoffii]
MEGFTLVDGGVAVVVLVSALLAFSRGFVREAMSIAGWIIAAVLAFTFAPDAEPLIREVPILGDFLRDSCEISMIAAFAAVFALALVIVSLFTPLLSSMIQHSALGGIDQGFGFLFGVARGVLLVAVAFLIYQAVVSSRDIAVVENSRSVEVFDSITAKIAERDPEQALGWLTRQYDQLMTACEKPTR